MNGAANRRHGIGTILRLVRSPAGAVFWNGVGLVLFRERIWHQYGSRTDRGARARSQDSRPPGFPGGRGASPRGFPQYHNIQLDLNTAAAHSHTSHTAAALAAATPAAAFGGGSKAGGGGGVARPSRPCGDAGASLGLVQSIDCTVPGLPENADFAGFQRGDLGKCLYVQSGLCVVGAMRHGALGDGSQCPPPPFRPCPLIPRLLVRKLGFWRPAPPAPRVPCPGPRCPGTVQEPRASSRHGRPRNGLGHAPTRKSAEPAASVACLQ